MTKERRSVENDYSGAHFSKPVLIACTGLPPAHGGTATIMKNLLSHLSPSGVVVATARPKRSVQKLSEAPRHKRHYVFSQTNLHGRIERFRRFLLRGVITKRLIRLAREMDCGAIVGVYPDLAMLDASQRAAAYLGIPFLPYLHDTVAEAAATTSYAGWANDIQRRAFETAPVVFVATHGMADLYRQKYDLKVVPLVHIYPEEVEPEILQHKPRHHALFWSGNVYSINSRSVSRVCEAMNLVGGLRFTFATGQSHADLREMGVACDHVDTTYVPVDRRSEYLDLIADHEILVLALNWPDETTVPFEELSTIFPTKSPEYLGSGRPILVHCPEDYYMARFFKEHGGAVIVGERSVEAIRDGINKVLEDQEFRNKLGRESIRAAREFSPENVVPVFHENVLSCLQESGI